ncbi:DUF2207 domain-containing protein [Aestuariispira insulae]|uniref:Putative membrane protein DUF2207 n=1 Tax=Aestuariispira insulae TaxID=1461337 RepID=A0A3D9HY05_9PROT|nr:DUF2207 domain-containing protein [Aestuariispira insulae]RED54387.1 putative membrane protein DUF2207 [Aestuariispira insulae]
MMMRFLAVFFFAALLSLGARAEERITDFAVEVVVQADGTLQVTEEIEVLSEGREIKRGIYRDIPLRTITAAGLNHVAGFELLDVWRDGVPEPYFTQDLAAGIRIYMGEESVFLKPGRHRYRIRYLTDRQLIHGSDLDELYWNVTGNDWAFPIDQASIRVTLPGGITIRQHAAYTGYMGEQGQDFALVFQGDNEMALKTTRRLESWEGFSIALGWPAGRISRPDASQEFAWVVQDNRGPIIGIVLSGFLVLYYWLVWRRVGRDPEKGTIIARFEPPEGLSPVGAGTIWYRGNGDRFPSGRAFSVALTSLATKGVITLEALGGGRYEARKLLEPHGLPDGERAVAENMFPSGRKITFGKKYDARISLAQDALGSSFGKEFEKLYFRNNWKQWLVGAIMTAIVSLATLMLDVTDSNNRAMVAFMVPFGAVFSIPSLFILVRLVQGIPPMIRRGSVGSWFAMIFMLLIAFAFLGPVGAIFYFVSDTVSPLAMIVALLPVPVTVAFYHWMKAPTLAGRDMLDQLEGYRLYLTVAEEDRLNMAGEGQEITEALFEKHLPYAMAMDAEDAWTERFSESLARSGHDPAAAGSYQPRWYKGDNRPWRSSLGGGLSSSLTGAASKAGSRPSSSSGSSSGGGSSGGGGGGGGGGGW